MHCNALLYSVSLKMMTSQVTVKVNDIQSDSEDERRESGDDDDIPGDSEDERLESGDDDDNGEVNQAQEKQAARVNQTMKSSQCYTQHTEGS